MSGWMAKPFPPSQDGMIQQKSFGGVGYPLGIMMSFTAE
jgi:hypothetical protein